MEDAETRDDARTVHSQYPNRLPVWSGSELGKVTTTHVRPMSLLGHTPGWTSDVVTSTLRDPLTPRGHVEGLRGFGEGTFGRIRPPETSFRLDPRVVSVLLARTDP